MCPLFRANVIKIPSHFNRESTVVSTQKVCHVSFLSFRYNRSGDLSKLFQVSPGKQSKQFHELLSMKWGLQLSWSERNETINNQRRTFFLLKLSAKLVPHPDFKEKLGDVWIAPGNITLCINDDPTNNNKTCTIEGAIGVEKEQLLSSHSFLV